MAPLPQLLTKQHGLSPRFLPDPAFSKKATLRDFLKLQQRVYVCLPHVSGQLMLIAATAVLVVEQALLCK
jgi:hypothetical protein